MERSKLAGTTVTLRVDIDDPFVGRIPMGSEYRVEDYWVNVAGQSWKDMVGNPATYNYSKRMKEANLPFDDNVLYGKIQGLGFLIHESELTI